MLIRLINWAIQGFDYNLMKNCPSPINTMNVSNYYAFRVKEVNYANIS